MESIYDIFLGLKSNVECISNYKSKRYLIIFFNKKCSCYSFELDSEYFNYYYFNFQEWEYHGFEFDTLIICYRKSGRIIKLYIKKNEEGS